MYDQIVYMNSYNDLKKMIFERTDDWGLRTKFLTEQWINSKKSWDSCGGEPPHHIPHISVLIAGRSGGFQMWEVRKRVAIALWSCRYPGVHTDDDKWRVTEVMLPFVRLLLRPIHSRFKLIKSSQKNLNYCQIWRSFTLVSFEEISAWVHTSLPSS